MPDLFVVAEEQRRALRRGDFDLPQRLDCRQRQATADLSSRNLEPDEPGFEHLDARIEGHEVADVDAEQPGLFGRPRSLVDPDFQVGVVADRRSSLFVDVGSSVRKDDRASELPPRASRS